VPNAFKIHWLKMFWAKVRMDIKEGIHQNKYLWVKNPKARHLPTEILLQTNLKILLTVWVRDGK
jgi:hypothetical protein